MDAAEPAGVKYARHLTADDVGQRVVVRHRLADGQSTDVLGQLLAWGDLVVVRDRAGTEHRFARAAVLAGKRVPPPPARR